MKIPASLKPLADDGMIDEVLRQLMSGKEANVFVVRCGDDIRCAKVYKDASQRSFHQAVEYTEGRKTKNSRQARAMAKGTRYGREAAQAAWHNAEVDALFRLAAAGVRVPKPYLLHEGVLLMELVQDAQGGPAPRLNDVVLTAADAVRYHGMLIREVVIMLCAGIVHGDLSEFNILLDAFGPVIIDLPQAINASANNSAKKLFMRDVDNLNMYFGQFAPELRHMQYGPEIWAAFELGVLQPFTPLTGHYKQVKKTVDVQGVLKVIDAAQKEEDMRRARLAQQS